MKGMSQTVVLPDLADDASIAGRWMTVIHNNETKSMDEVVEILMLATGCDEEEAGIEMWEAHTYGKAPVHFASRAECLNAAAIVASIGIRTEVSPEWDD